MAPIASATTTTDARPLLAVRDLSVVYPDGTQALTGVSFTVGRGAICGLLGRNGAGKSTLLRVLATLQQPNSGSVVIDGIDAVREPATVRERLGYLPQEFGFPPALTALELLDHAARLKGFDARSARDDAVHAMLAQVNLTADRHRRAKTLSGGMKQRLGLAIALLGAPTVLIVDEPTVALDPAERYRVHALLGEVAESRAVLFSTHLVSDVEALCHDVLLLHGGRVVRSGNAAALTEALKGQIFRARIPRHEVDAVRKSVRVLRENLVGGLVQLTVLADRAPDARFVAAAPEPGDVFADATGAG